MLSLCSHPYCNSCALTQAAAPPYQSTGLAFRQGRSLVWQRTCGMLTCPGKHGIRHRSLPVWSAHCRIHLAHLAFREPVRLLALSTFPVRTLLSLWSSRCPGKLSTAMATNSTSLCESSGSIRGAKCGLPGLRKALGKVCCNQNTNAAVTEV